MVLLLIKMKLQIGTSGKQINNRSEEVIKREVEKG
jgi:hypothetical protein